MSSSLHAEFFKQLHAPLGLRVIWILNFYPHRLSRVIESIPLKESTGRYDFFYFSTAREGSSPSSRRILCSSA
jgi:hypothetical protein